MPRPKSQYSETNLPPGVFKIDEKRYGCRIVILRNGKRVDTTKRQDDNRKPFDTFQKAQRYREQKLLELEQELAKGKSQKAKGEYGDCTMQEAWDMYIKDIAPSRRPATSRKYASLWKVHVKERFGNRLLSEIDTIEINAFLDEMYRVRDYSYTYVESFLKLFYQLFGIAYAKFQIDPNRYTRMFVDSGTKLQMPKITQEDNEEYNTIKAYRSFEINKIEQAFRGGNCYLAFMFGYYCGLRIGETFGLMWSDYDWGAHTIMINKQMVYEDGVFCLRPVKTLQSSRTIEVPNVLHEYLKELFRKQYRHPPKGYNERKCEIVIDKTSEKRDNYTKIVGGDFINRKENGELLTPNSIKYYAKKIKKEHGIEFKYHSLRKTHLTQLANANMPINMVMQRAGHKKYSTTLKYYVTQNEDGVAQLRAFLNTITTKELMVEVDDGKGGKKMVEESRALNIQQASKIIPH